VVVVAAGLMSLQFTLAADRYYDCSIGMFYTSVSLLTSLAELQSKYTKIRPSSFTERAIETAVALLALRYPAAVKPQQERLLEMRSYSCCSSSTAVLVAAHMQCPPSSSCSVR
jgi:hypothetical protein